MRTIRRPVFIAFFATLCFVLAAAACLHSADSRADSISVEEAAIRQIAGHEQWLRVNPQPRYLPSWLDTLCRNPMPEELKKEAQNPHIHEYLTVYVNDIGRRAMTEEAKPHFPVGSIVVKEKLRTKEDRAPDMMTAMIKREAGYDPAGGDWEYMALDGSGQPIGTPGKLPTCRSCHAAQKRTDYLFRSYLPEKMARRLR